MNQADDVSLPIGELRVLGPQIDIKITERTKICNTVAKSNVLFFYLFPLFSENKYFPFFQRVQVSMIQNRKRRLWDPLTQDMVSVNDAPLTTKLLGRDSENEGIFVTQ